MDELPESSATGSNDASGSQLEVLDYLRGVESSTCLLLATPSPTPRDFKHPLSEEMNEGPFLKLNDGPMVDLQSCANCDGSGGDSCSSGGSSSVVQDPVSAQLINNISMLDYQTLSKNGDLVIGQVEDCKINGNLNLGNRKLPNFVNWNWGIIRKVMLWVVLSGLVACLGAIVTMVVNIPMSCDPDLPWYHGKVFYEVFPSFEDTNNEGAGGLKGIINQLDYIQELNVSAIRLNFIFKTDSQYYNTTSLKEIDRSIGVIEDFQKLVEAVHGKNMSIILDIPVWSLASPLSSSNQNATQDRYFDPISDAIDFWAREHCVDGFYLKNLERFVTDDHFGRTLQLWKQIIGHNKILIASERAFEKLDSDSLNIFLSRIDLVDVRLDLNGSVKELKIRIKNVINGRLWEKPHYPWVHWNIGNIRHINNAIVLTVLEFVLPGTLNVFYGNEIGFGDLPINKAETDFDDKIRVDNLVKVKIPTNDKKEKNILQWQFDSELGTKFHFLQLLKSLIRMRLRTPTIYLRSIFKDGNMLNNTAIRETEENLLVIERWYPRRNTCVFVGNLGNKTIATDLTSMFFGGTVISGTNTSLVGQMLYFDHVTFPPKSALILKLEK